VIVLVHVRRPLMYCSREASRPNGSRSFCHRTTGAC